MSAILRLLGRFFGVVITGFACLCVATVISQAIMIGYLAMQGQIGRYQLLQITSVLQGTDILKLKIQLLEDVGSPSDESPAHEDVLRARAVEHGNLRLKQQAVETALAVLKRQSARLTEQKTGLDRVAANFQQELVDLENKEIDEGLESVRIVWENIAPAQAKQLILGMIDDDEVDDIVIMLREMPINKKKRIVAEFAGPDDEKLELILDKTRRGDPLAALIQETRNQFAPPAN